MLLGLNTKVYEKPPTDVYEAVFADCVDLGNEEHTYEGKTTIQHKIRFLWVLDTKDSKGEHFQIFQKLTNSFDEKANMYKTLKSMIGAPPAVGLDPEIFVGKGFRLSIETVEGKDGKPWSTIKSILPSKVPFAVPAGFVRDKDKPTDKQYANKPPKALTPSTNPSGPVAASIPAFQPLPEPATAPITDEDIPF